LELFEAFLFHLVLPERLDEVEKFFFVFLSGKNFGFGFVIVG
jgi:hypothetical protein